MDFDKLIQQPESTRDDKWEAQFLDAIVSINVEVQAKGEPITGPDGWPYISVRTGRGDEPAIKLVRWLAGRGIGLVVNSFKMAPDYVFTYGMLWNYVETGRFITPLQPGGAGDANLADLPIRGAPTDKYLPPYVRSIMKDFLKAQGIPTPRLLVATSQDYKQTDLVFSMESMGSPNPMEQRTLAEALSWFLPLHYSMIFVPELSLRGWVEL